jgi:LuxR family transcriptional regulator
VAEAFERGALSEAEAAAVRQNAAMGVTAGITVSFPETSSRAKGALGMIADPGLDHDAVESVWAERRQEIMAVANMMHLKIVNMPGANRRRPLTQGRRVSGSPVRSGGPGGGRAGA